MTKGKFQRLEGRVDLGDLERMATIEAVRADEDGARVVELAFSSEAPVSRWFGDEILDHERSSVRLERVNRGVVPLLVDHNRTDLVGRVDKVEIGGDRVGRATVRFGKSARADEIFSDVQEGIRQGVSVGYRIHHMRLEEEGEDGAVYRVDDWEPFEISVVSIPADPTVGVGRSAGDGDGHMTIVETVKEDRNMPPEKDQNAAPATGTDTGAAAAAAVALAQERAPAIDPEQIRRETLKIERERTEEIARLGALHKQREFAEEHIARGTPIDEFRGLLLNKLPQATRLDAGASQIGMSDSEVRQFSLTRAILYLGSRGDPRIREMAAFELECSAAAEKQYGRSTGGILIPDDVLIKGRWPGQARMGHNGGPAMEGRRDLSVGTATAGGHTVATDLLAGSFIDVLRNRLVTARLGITVLDGLQGNVAIPRKTSGASAGWISSEGGNAAESQPAFDQVTLSPKTLGAYTEYTRQLLLQSSLAIEALVRNDLATAIALSIDDAVLEGSGASGQPTGIKNQSGINTTTFAAADPTYAEVVAMETAVAVDNADMGTLAYCTDAAMRGAFKTTEKASGTAMFIWEPGDTVNGYRTEISNQVTDGDVYFGNWADAFLGLWGGLDLLLDPYTNSAAATIRIVAHQSPDVAVRHPVSFCVSNDGV